MESILKRLFSLGLVVLIFISNCVADDYEDFLADRLLPDSKSDDKKYGFTEAHNKYWEVIEEMEGKICKDLCGCIQAYHTRKQTDGLYKGLTAHPTYKIGPVETRGLNCWHEHPQLKVDDDNFRIVISKDIQTYFLIEEIGDRETIYEATAQIIGKRYIPSRTDVEAQGENIPDECKVFYKKLPKNLK